MDEYRYHYVCRCGEKWPALPEDYDAEIALHAAHVAAVVEAAGLTVIALPEPHGRWAEGPEWVQGADRSGWVTWTAEGAQQVMLQRVEPGELSPNEARDLAAALIAAAQVAERNNHE